VDLGSVVVVAVEAEEEEQIQAAEAAEGGRVDSGPLAVYLVVVEVSIPWLKSF
jgi:hypothetical protein